MSDRVATGFKDKNDVLREISSRDKVILDLGCGDTKIVSDAIGIDVLDSEAVDIVGDATIVLGRFPSSSVDAIDSNHFLEHLDNVGELLTEVHRVLKTGGYFRIKVPHFSNPFFYSDPTHKHFFGLYTFSYYANAKVFRRTVPSYSRVPGLEFQNASLIFKSYRPNYIRHGMKKALELFVNSTTWTKEFYEENLTGILPCYEIEAVLRKAD